MGDKKPVLFHQQIVYAYFTDAVSTKENIENTAMFVVIKRDRRATGLNVLFADLLRRNRGQRIGEIAAELGPEVHTG